MRALFVFMFFAVEALAQPQTKVDIYVYSLDDKDYHEQLNAARQEAAKANNNIAVAKLDFLLKAKDPDDYRNFIALLRAKVETWKQQELAKGSASPIFGRNLTLSFSPYGPSLDPGDVQITVIWKNAEMDGRIGMVQLIGTVKMTDGINAAYQKSLMLLTVPLTSPILPTSARRIL